MYQFHDTPSIGMKVLCYWDRGVIQNKNMSMPVFYASNFEKINFFQDIKKNCDFYDSSYTSFTIYTVLIAHS
jgi:hypothetical protein